MCTFRNKRKLAAFNKDSQEKHARKNLSVVKNDPKIYYEYITQVSEEIDGKVTENTSQSFKKRRAGY